MSYILESLKKSEQKRKQLEQPGLYSEPLGTLARTTSGRKLWPYLVSAALLLNTGLIGWYLLEQRDSANRPMVVTPVQQPLAPAAATLPAPAATAPAAGLVSVAPVAGPEQTQNFKPVIIEPVKEVSAVKPVTHMTVRPGPPVTNTEPIPVSQLSSAQQQQLPPLVLSLHYYAGPGANSMIRLDGEILRAGAQVQDGLSVREIVADGVILDFQGRLIWLARPQG
jgi:general secretion pathway protein B